MKYKDRIKELRRVPASSLAANPKNWRTHPTDQAGAMRSVLDEIGWADAVLARETEAGLELIDGHLRKEVAPDDTIPVLVLDVTEQEADIILATHDPLAEMAKASEEQLDLLLSSLDVDSPEISDLLSDLSSSVAEQAIKDLASQDFEEYTAVEKDPDLVVMTIPLDRAQDESIQQALRIAKKKFETGSSGDALERALSEWVDDQDG